MLNLFRGKNGYVIGLLAGSLLIGCHTTIDLTPTVDNTTVGSARLLIVSLSEGFEVGSTSPKTAYDASPTGSSSGDNVTLQGKSWNLYDAVIGNLSGDLKAGSWSARVRNTGKITMLFEQTTGISTLTVKHGTYGSDTPSQWGLWYSINSGSSWTQSGANVTTTSTLQTQTFTLNVSGTVRVEIRKLTGSTNRINIDDIAINDYTGGGGTDYCT